MNGLNAILDGLEAGAGAAETLVIYKNLYAAQSAGVIEVELSEIGQAENSSVNFTSGTSLGVVQGESHLTMLEQLAGPLKALAQTEVVLDAAERAAFAEDHADAIKVITNLALMNDATEGDLVYFIESNPHLEFPIPGINQPFPRNFEILARLALAKLSDAVVTPEMLHQSLLDLIETGSFASFENTIKALIKAEKLSATAWAEAMSQQLTLRAKAGDLNKVQYLRAAGANPSASLNAIQDNGITALMEAVVSNRIDQVQALLAAGADVEKTVDDLTPLVVAASRDCVEIVRALVAGGPTDVNAKTYNSNTALTAAADLGHAEIVRYLLAVGADVNAKTGHGNTALTLAAGRGHAEKVRALLAAGADVNAKDACGNTALIFAASKGYTEIVRALLEDPRIDVDAKNDEGYTPLMYAAMQEREGYQRYRYIVSALRAAPRKTEPGHKPMTNASMDVAKGHAAFWSIILNPPTETEMTEMKELRPLAPGSLL